MQSWRGESMLNQFFGHYLLNRGLLASEELCNAIRQEKQVKVKLGTLAVNQGLMTAAQVEEVHALQQRCDQLFGKLAVEMGYLNQEEVEQLLAQQQEEPLALLQTISDQGYLPLAKLEQALREFRSEYGMKPGYDATLPYPLQLLFPFLVEDFFISNTFDSNLTPPLLASPGTALYARPK